MFRMSNYMILSQQNFNCIQDARVMYNMSPTKALECNALHHVIPAKVDAVYLTYSVRSTFPAFPQGNSEKCLQKDQISTISDVNQGKRVVFKCITKSADQNFDSIHFCKKFSLKFETIGSQTLSETFWNLKLSVKWSQLSIQAMW